MRFHVVVAAYNARPWIGRCLRSIRRQRDAAFRCAVLDDQSDDGTLEAAEGLVGGDPRFLLERSPRRRYPLGNLLAGIQLLSPAAEDVIVIVDGDDWLMHARVLSRLAEVYADPQVWLTYGSHQRWKNKLLHRVGWTRRRGIAAPYPADVVARRAWRTHPFLASHLRTFRRFLFDAIPPEDLHDESGGLWRAAADVATMIPMLEMAGADHVRYIDEMLYVYNNSNPISERRVVLAPQQEVVRALQSRPPRPALLRGGTAP